MEFRILFYERVDSSGQPTEAPVQDFLDTLRKRYPDREKLVVAGLRKLRNRDDHGSPLTEQVDPENHIYELRVGRTNIARVFFFFRPGHMIVVTNGYVKKQQKTDTGELDRARTYKNDWEERDP